MANYKYSVKVTENMAAAVARSIPASTKDSIEICTMVRGKEVGDAKLMLNQVLDMKRAVPMKRFNMDRGHKVGIGPGKFPLKATGHILKTIESAESNASDKGLGKKLMIKHISAQQASRPIRFGRHRGRLGKRTHIEVVLEESKEVKK